MPSDMLMNQHKSGHLHAVRKVERSAQSAQQGRGHNWGLGNVGSIKERRRRISEHGFMPTLII